MNAVSELLDKQIHVVAPPIAAIFNAVSIGRIRIVVGNGEPCHRIGIEIIIDMKTIHIIAPHDVGRHFANIRAVGGLSGVHDELSIVGKHAAGIFDGHMIGCQLLRALGFGAERINPCVQLHAAPMAFGHHPLQRVPKRIGSHALLARQIAAPWLERTVVERIALGPHLKDDGIHAVALQLVQLLSELALHLVAAKPFKLSVDTLNPRAAELTFLLCAERQHLQQQAK